MVSIKWLFGFLTGVAMAATAHAAAERIAYGSAASQFGELWLPAQAGPAPVVVLIHGGCWQDSYGLGLMNRLAANLRDHGAAVWNIEYRRLGEAGGGYPGTFADVGASIDALRGLARRYAIDPDRVAIVGHSAGGHLALWAAARSRLPAASPLKTGDPLPIRLVVTLAGINDLAAYHERGPACGGGATIDALIDARRRGPDAFADTSPRALLPLGVPQLIVSGDNDGIVPASFGRDYAAAAKAAGDPVAILDLPDEDHFALIDPGSGGWPSLREQILRVLSQPAAAGSINRK
jgi:acetyl esterase/lipase